MQGMAFAKHVFGEDPQGKPDYEYIPSAVFSSPPIANVGLSEEEAVEQYKNIDVFTSSYKYAPVSLPEPDLARHSCRDTALDFQWDILEPTTGLLCCCPVHLLSCT